MAAVIFILSCLAATVAAIAVPVKTIYAEPESPAHYEFSYSVEDHHTGDMKDQHENRAGDAVHGSYSLLQPDGMKKNPPQAPTPVGYAHAPVAKIAYAPAPITKVAYASGPIAKVAYAPAPIAKVAYAPAVTKVAYATAPLTKVAYAPTITKVAYAPAAKVTYPAKILPAPIAKVAYTQPLGHVTFSSPAISYHH
ncbi:Cuticle protein [Eumeta japonica]|uniref:Cuticle protein n=1 Tax=Eumeta variegata TaxID=151549 RepID=A0A4C1W2A8_EUMVA|nr:Cuticle protein [Eumeta japonica]